MDSGAGQTMIALGATAVPGTVQSCAIDVEGIGGEIRIRQIATSDLLVLTSRKREVILRIPNSLQTPGAHSLLSLSQIQMQPGVKVSLRNEDPYIDVENFRIPLSLENGTFPLSFRVLAHDDPRKLKLPILQIAPAGEYTPPTSYTPDGKIRWRASNVARLPLAYMANKLCVPLQAFGSFRSKVAAMADGVFIDSTTRPKARRTYTNSASDLEDLSTRFMNTSTERLKHTIEVSNGLSPTKGTVRPNRFPQATLRKGKVPMVSKNKVHHLHEASVAECVYTDTFETDCTDYRYGQAYMCYKSRYGAVFPMKSRRQVVSTFEQFCADIFTPKILIRDNISENVSKALLKACRKAVCQSGYSTPYIPQQDYAEGFIGHVCRLASFAMVYSGAPMFLWRYAILCGVFIHNITAGFYSLEGLWATPYELIYGEPFPDSSIVMPFGCAALVLLAKGKRRKLGNRCALMVFIHYATQHPTYTYAFWSPRTGRVFYRQDAIFLVDVFPLRWGNKTVTSSTGDLLIPYVCERSPTSIRTGTPKKHSFDDWAGPTLPSFENHLRTDAGAPAGTAPTVSHEDDTFPPPRHIPEGQHLQPDPLGFGPTSSVTVPPPLAVTNISRATGSSQGVTGRTVFKDFGKHGIHKGIVEAHDAPSDLYHVVYADGDEEDLTKAEANELWSPDFTPQHKRSRLQRGDKIRAAPTLFDVTDPVEGEPLYSSEHPNWCYGEVNSVSNGIAKIKWEGGMEGSANARDLIRVGPVSSDDSSDFIDNGAGSTLLQAPQHVHSPPTATTQPSSSKAKQRRARKLRLPPRTAVSALTKTVRFPSELRAAAPSYQPPSGCTTHAAFDTDAQCVALVNQVFLDPDFGKCTITHWDTEGGDRRVFYRTESSQLATVPAILHTTLELATTWVKRNKELSAPSGTTLFWKKVTGVFGYPCENIRTLSEEIDTVKIQGLVSNMQRNHSSAHASKWPLRPISTSKMRLVLKAKASIFKYGVHVPKNDREVDLSPERRIWKAARTLEWLRLLKAGAFEGQWTKASIAEHFPHVHSKDIGHVFFVYDYKHSGEAKARLVFDGSRQSPDTYDETFAPTARPESVRLFHLYCVEHSHAIGQYDVPQAFLQADAEGDIFFYPPPGCSDFQGQIYKCKLNLYGTKNAARVWYLRFIKFLKQLGFEADTMDPCFFRRLEPDGLYSLIITHVDDSRVGAAPAVLQEIYDALFQEFQITVADGSRFLGMDVEYDRDAGFLKLHMKTYLEETVARFESCDTTSGYPLREIVGCILWACNVHGGDLMRAKALASKCNDFTAADFSTAMKLLYRMRDRGSQGIIFRRGGATSIRIPPTHRPGKGEDGSPTAPTTDAYHVGAEDLIDEFGEKDLYRDCDAEQDAQDGPPDLPTTQRFKIVAYTDASFAVTDKMQSISGWVVYVNGTPIFWGSMKQTVVVDSSCSAEYVAASMCTKKVKELEHLLIFLGILCEKPYIMYTDSQAARAIANNNNTLGNVRHLSIRTHLTRCHIALGDIKLAWCPTEWQVSDLFTKIVSASQEKGLLPRFYNDCVTTEGTGSSSE